MAAPLAGTSVRRPMPWDEYLALDADVPGEYVDGHLVMAPSPDRQHQLVCVNLVILLRQFVPAGYETNLAWQWSPAIGQNFIPDVMVYPTTIETTRLTSTPVLAVEVLSQNRTDDLVVKTSRYAAAGLEHYWVIDRAAGELRVFELRSGVYAQTQVVRDEPAEVGIGVAIVTVNLSTLLGR